MRRFVQCVVTATLILIITAATGLAQSPGSSATQPAPSSRSLAPTFRDIAYASTDDASRAGHLLDLYLPGGPSAPTPLVIFSAGSAWMANNGRQGAAALAAELNKAGYAVAGVAIRNSAQTTFPGQLHDIKAAIRWLRANAAKYNIAPDHIGITGESSGGWTAAMAAVTGDVPELEGNVGVTGVSSAVQATIAYYPPTDFLQMDSWAVRPCAPSAMIGQGASDPAVPHAQGEMLYQALNKACHDAVFRSLPTAGHGIWLSMMTDPRVNAAATRRTTSSNGCAVENPTPFTPTWATVIEFFDRYLK